MKKARISGIRTLIVGAGQAGELLANDIKNQKASGIRVIGFVDDDPAKIGKKIAGHKVLGNLSEINKIVFDHEVDDILIALPSERGKLVRQIVESTSGLRLTYRILPRLSEVLLQENDKDYLRYVRQLETEDLLGGEILKSDQSEIKNYAKKQTILVTGAAGSIGSELSRQLAAYGISNLILFDWWENGVYELRNQILSNFPDANVSYVIGDVKDQSRVEFVINKFKPSTIFHAAAYKHVPLMEDNPNEAIKNNILGTKTVAEAAIKYKVDKFVLISTDKAVNPTNIMGATKRAAEKLISLLAQGQKNTIFCAVRFGNVINSNGSAIPYFERQIKNGGPVTVTHKDITRYFMTIPEAVHLILQSWILGKNNDLFVLDMGEPVKIYDLAKLLITMRGYIPGEDIMIKVIGLRPGEKLYEEVMVKEEEVQATSIKKVYKTKNYLGFDDKKFIDNLSQLLEYVKNEHDDNRVFDLMKDLISTYKQPKI